MNWSQFTDWWKLMAAAGVVIIVASINHGFVFGYLFGAVFLLFGIGEWINHRVERKEKQSAPEGMIGFRMISVRPWTPSVTGLIFDALAIAVFGFLIYRAVAH